MRSQSPHAIQDKFFSILGSPRTSWSAGQRRISCTTGNYKDHNSHSDIIELWPVRRIKFTDDNIYIVRVNEAKMGELDNREIP